MPAPRPWWKPSLDPAGLRPWLRRAILENPWVKILSLLFAFAIWAWVQGERVVEQKAHVEVEWVLPDKLAAVEDLPTELTITVSGSQVFVKNVRRADMHLTVDLSKAKVGRQRIEFDEGQVDGVPEAVRVLSLAPTFVEIELDEKVRRKFRVSPMVSGEPAPGFRLAGVTTRPVSVELEGPRSLLSELQGVATVVVDITGIETDLDREVSLADLPRHVVPVGEEPLQVAVDVEPIRTTSELEAVRVLAANRAWEPVPAQVAVVLDGPVARLESARAEDVWVLVEVDADAPERTLRATGIKGVARWRVFHPYGDEVEVRRIKPETIEVRPAR